VDVALHVPFQIKEGYGDASVERLRLFNSEDQAQETKDEVDDTLHQLGFETALGPPKHQDFEISKDARVGDQVMKTSLDRVWTASGILAPGDRRITTARSCARSSASSSRPRPREPSTPG